MADGLLALPPTHLLREWSVPIGRGQLIGEQMATPSFQCLPRWLPLRIYGMLRIWGSLHIFGSPGVYCPSSQGCPGEIFYPGQLK